MVIGAGSRSFGQGVLADVFSSKDLNQLDCTLSLVDINEEALNRMTTFAEKMQEYYGSKVKIEATTDRLKALPGANYVIISVAIKRMELWEQDFRIPLAYGFKHVLGENGGPGALFLPCETFNSLCQSVRMWRSFAPKPWS